MSYPKIWQYWQYSFPSFPYHKYFWRLFEGGWNPSNLHVHYQLLGYFLIPYYPKVQFLQLEVHHFLLIREFGSIRVWFCNNFHKIFQYIDKYNNPWVNLECPRSWWIMMIYHHIEGIYKWVNSAPIFFWYQLLWTTCGPQ